MELKNIVAVKVVSAIAITGGAGGLIFAIYNKQSENPFIKKDDDTDTLADDEKQKEDDYQIKELNADENSYLITTLTSNKDKPEELLTGSKKNYYCQIEQNKKIDCEVSLVDFDKTKKSVDLSKIKDLTSSTEEKTILKDASVGSYFKLKLNSEDLSKFNSSLAKTIDLVSNSPKTKSVFATLSTEFKVEKGDVGAIKKTVVVVVVVAAKKSSSGTESVDIKKYKCASDSMSSSKECTIYNFSTDITSTAEISSIDFSKNNLTDINNLEMIKDEKKLSALTLPWVSLGEINSLINFEPYKDGVSDEENKKTYQLTPKARLFGNFGENTKGVFFELITLRGNVNQAQK